MDSRYLTPGVVTELGKSAESVTRLPCDFGGIARVLQGLCIHEFLIGMYGVDQVDKETVHLRRASDLFDTIISRDPGPPKPASPFDASLFDRMAAGRVPVSVPGTVYSAVRDRLEPFT